MIKPLARNLIAPLLASLLGVPVLALPAGNTIEFSNCKLELPGTTLMATARCGWLELAENPAEPQGRRIRLHVALVPAAARKAAADPLFLFAGGPGQAAGEAYVMLQQVLADIRKNRDIVLVDQRGTGQSHPLDCPGEESDGLDQSVDLDKVRQSALACLAALDADPRYYTTTLAMQDYEQVREAMAYPQINLLGISYGTRAAQVYLRHYPGRVRSMILDSVVPMSLNLGEEHGRMLDRALAQIFTDCANIPDCQARFPAGMMELKQLSQSLRERPSEIRFVHPLSGEVEELAVSADVLAVAIRFLSYRTETQATLPLLVHEAVTNGTLSRLAAQAHLIVGAINEQISAGMERSVICSEDLPFMPEALEENETLLGGTLLDVVAAVCEVWPSAKVAPDFHDPVSAQIPVLLLSGLRDPVTPPAYAAETARHFENHLNLVASGLGHAVIANHCLQGIATRFVENGSVDDLDTTCVGQIEPAPFFTTLLGPPP